MLKQGEAFNLANYSVERKDTVGGLRAHGGVAILITRLSHILRSILSLGFKPLL
jgi:hypothetical protein